MSNIVERAWLELIQENIFYSYVKMKFDSLETKTVRTIKVSITANGNFRLLYNPMRLESKGLIFTKALLKHEIYHIIFGHFFIKYKNKREKGVWDLCMDACVNQFIDEMDALSVPLDVMLLEGHAPDNEYFFVTCPIDKPNLTAQEYFDYAMGLIEEKRMVDLDMILEQRENIDTHDFDMEITEEMAFDIISEFVQNAYDKSSSNSPEGVEMAVKIIRNKPKFKWNTILRRFFGSSVIVDKYRTVLRPNRRYEDQPGWKNELGPNIAVVVDTSGSIIEEEYNQFFGEIESIAKNTGGKVRLVQADNKVQNVIEYSKGGWQDISLKGKGSTDLQPAVEYLEKKYRPEGIIIFTDGWVEVPNVMRRVLFVLSEKYNVDFFNQVLEYYGKNSVIVISKLSPS